MRPLGPPSHPDQPTLEASQTWPLGSSLGYPRDGLRSRRCPAAIRVVHTHAGRTCGPVAAPPWFCAGMGTRCAVGDRQRHRHPPTESLCPCSESRVRGPPPSDGSIFHSCAPSLPCGHVRGACQHPRPRGQTPKTRTQGKQETPTPLRQRLVSTSAQAPSQPPNRRKARSCTSSRVQVAQWRLALLRTRCICVSGSARGASVRLTSCRSS